MRTIESATGLSIAPLETSARTEEMSVSASAGWSAIRFSMVGTPTRWVGRSAVTASSAAPASNRLSSWTVAPQLTSATRPSEPKEEASGTRTSALGGSAAPVLPVPPVLPVLPVLRTAAT